MNEQIQNILTLLVIAGAAVYTAIAIKNLFKRQTGDGCTSHGCPSCGIKHELKQNHQKKMNLQKMKPTNNCQ